jgi:ornithine carbamoyltransferase
MTALGVAEAKAAATAHHPLPAHVLSAADFGAFGLERLLDRAESLRTARTQGLVPPLLAGRQVAMLFEKPSLRTRVSFDAGVAALGGHAIYLGPDEVGLNRRESAADVGANLSRWVDAIVVRTFAHATLVELAQAASVPVVNALTDREHPCQALADLLTIRQHRSSLAGRRLAFVGDGNNVAHSLLIAGALAGLSVTVATPAGYEPQPELVQHARRLARTTGAAIDITHDPGEAVAGADAVYTDVWASMGSEDEHAERRRRFAAYQVNAALLRDAPNALVMHCMPAHRGEEISGEVLDGPLSVALDQAENRLYAQQSLLVELLSERSPRDG